MITLGFPQAGLAVGQTDMDCNCINQKQCPMRVTFKISDESLAASRGAMNQFRERLSEFLDVYASCDIFKADQTIFH